jgi:hypothetical protein
MGPSTGPQEKNNLRFYGEIGGNANRHERQLEVHCQYSNLSIAEIEYKDRRTILYIWIAQFDWTNFRLGPCGLLAKEEVAKFNARMKKITIATPSDCPAYAYIQNKFIHLIGSSKSIP